MDSETLLHILQKRDEYSPNKRINEFSSIDHVMERIIIERPCTTQNQFNTAFTEPHYIEKNNFIDGNITNNESEYIKDIFTKIEDINHNVNKFTPTINNVKQNYFNFENIHLTGEEFPRLRSNDELRHFDSNCIAFMKKYFTPDGECLIDIPSSQVTKNEKLFETNVTKGVITNNDLTIGKENINVNKFSPQKDNIEKYNQADLQKYYKIKYEFNEVRREMNIPNDLIGCIIGRGGTKINEIRKNSQANIKISNGDTGVIMRKITITGSPKSVEIAETSIHQSLLLHKHLLAMNIAMNEMYEGQEIKSLANSQKPVEKNEEVGVKTNATEPNIETENNLTNDVSMHRVLSENIFTLGDYNVQDLETGSNIPILHPAYYKSELYRHLGP